VLHERYFDLLRRGKKRIECRLSAIRRPPFESVGPGDHLWLKLPSRGVRGIAVVGAAISRSAGDGDGLVQWVQRYSRDIAADRPFFADAADWARFATLIWIQSLVTIQPMRVSKADQRAWVVLAHPPFPGMRIGGGSQTGFTART
jgi:hypothetical protein